MTSLQCQLELSSTSLGRCCLLCSAQTLADVVFGPKQLFWCRGRSVVLHVVCPKHKHEVMEDMFNQRCHTRGSGLHLERLLEKHVFLRLCCDADVHLQSAGCVGSVLVFTEADVRLQPTNRVAVKVSVCFNLLLHCTASSILLFLLPPPPGSQIIHHHSWQTAVCWGA